ncbi:MAG: hypothetical protein AB1705_27870 [Verrucomicrobiota bacterium]
MTEFTVPFASADYFILLAVVVFSRAADFISTWIGTPNLELEANPLSRRLGWRGGVITHAVLALIVAMYPLPAIVLSTTSVLVAAHNFQSAWLMRALGEARYSLMVAEQMSQASWSLYVFCLFAQNLLIGGVGAAVMLFSGGREPVLAIGLGIVGYALVVVFYTLLSVWHGRRFMR